MTTACASANDAIGEAFREIKFGFHDVVLAGGAEASITKIGIGGFNALTALSTTEDPERCLLYTSTYDLIIKLSIYQIKL